MATGQSHRRVGIWRGGRYTGGDPGIRDIEHAYLRSVGAVWGT